MRKSQVKVKQIRPILGFIWPKIFWHLQHVCEFKPRYMKITNHDAEVYLRLMPHTILRKCNKKILQFLAN